jgi:hypothetical protein
MPEPVRRGGTSLVDLLDRVVEKGAVISGDLIISLADIDLIRVDLRVLVIGIDEAFVSMPARRP